MRIFYADDSGQRKKLSSDRYFVFGGFGIDGSQVHRLKLLQQEVFASVPGMGAPGDELKFSSVGQQKHSLRFPNPFAREGVALPDRINMIQTALIELGNIPSVEAISVVIDKKHAFGATPLEHAFRVLMERIQISASEKSKNTLILCDEDSAQNQLREIHSENASQYLKYENIVETISFVPSHLSPGVQFADLIAGSVGRMLNHGDQKYFEKVIPYLRAGPGQKWRKYGLALFPSKPEHWSDFNTHLQGF